MSRTRRVDSRKDLERSVDEFITRGYKLKSQGDTSARLQEKDWGDSGVHIIIALLTVWWTLGLANALYAVYKRATAAEVIIRVEGTEPSADERENRTIQRTAGTGSDQEPSRPGGTDGWESGSDTGPDSDPQTDRGQQSRADHRSPSVGTEANGQRSAEQDQTDGQSQFGTRTREEESDTNSEGRSDRTIETDPEHRSDGKTEERFDDP